MLRTTGISVVMPAKLQRLEVVGGALGISQWGLGFPCANLSGRYPGVALVFILHSRTELQLIDAVHDGNLHSMYGETVQFSNTSNTDCARIEKERL